MMIVFWMCEACNKKITLIYKVMHHLINTASFCLIQ